MRGYVAGPDGRFYHQSDNGTIREIDVGALPLDNDQHGFLSNTHSEDVTMAGRMRIDASEDATMAGRMRIDTPEDTTMAGRARVDTPEDATMAGRMRIDTPEDLTAAGRIHIS